MDHDDGVSTAVDYYNTIIASGELEKKFKERYQYLSALSKHLQEITEEYRELQ
jgi:hypothetical protein